MNPPHRSSSVHRSAVPGYRKWYFGAGGSPGRRGMEAAPEPDPLPFEEIHEHAEITVGPPSTSADGYSAHGTFTIPEGAEGKKLYGTCSLFLGVDDWGILEVKDSGGKVVAQVDLARERTIEVPGPLGVTLIEIRPGRARVAADPGPRQYCVRQGWLTQAGAVAICAPNEVSLSLTGRAADYDSLNY